MNDAISRSDLEKRIRVYADQVHFRGEFELANGILKALMIIKDAPALDAQPVVHASLQETGFDEAYCNWGNCTNCGNSNIINSKYCNECGAHLDGDPHDPGQ